MARLWAGEVGSRYPGVCDGELVCLLGKDLLPLLVACQVIEIGSGHLTEVTPPELHAADVLSVVQLLVLLSAGEEEGLDGLVSIILAQRVITLQTEGFTEDGTVGGIGPGCHGGTTCLEHHTPVGARVGNAL